MKQFNANELVNNRLELSNGFLKDQLKNPLKSKEKSNTVNLSDVRNDAGLTETKKMLTQSAENIYRMNPIQFNQSPEYHTPIMLGLAGNDKSNNVNLAEILGTEQLNGLAGRTVTDITSKTMVESFVPYACIDRAMAQKEQSISYINIYSSTGELIKDNFSPFPYTDDGVGTYLMGSVKTLSSPAESGANNINFGTAIARGKTNLLIEDITDPASPIAVAKASDIGLNGAFLFEFDGIGLGLNATSINYTNGIVTITSDKLLPTHKITVTAQYVLGTVDGSNLVKIKPEAQYVTMIAQENAIQYELDMTLLFDITKTLANDMYSSLNLLDTMTDTCTSYYINSINNSIINNLWTATQTNGILPIIDSRLIQFGVFASNSSARDTQVKSIFYTFYNNFKKDISLNGVSVFTSYEGSSIMNSLTTLVWESGQPLGGGDDGYIGKLGIIPFFSHRRMIEIEDRINAQLSLEDQQQYADPVDPTKYIPFKRVPFIMTLKAPDNSTACLAYGEFIPLFSTGAVNNFLNATNIASKFTAMNAIKIINAKLARLLFLDNPTGVSLPRA